eukprot:6460965-Amphidinium_carterae.1
MWHQWLSDLRLLQDQGQLTDLPAPCMDCVSTWAQRIILLQMDWKRILRTALLPAHKPSATAVRRLAYPPNPRAPHLFDDEFAIPVANVLVDTELEYDYDCNVCNRSFKSYTALATHKRAAHQLYNPLSLRISTTFCPACLSHLGTRAKVLLHLRDRLECSLIVLDSIPAPPLQSFLESLPRLNKLNTCHTRKLIPRRGRIPTIGGKPRSQAEKPAEFNLIIPINSTLHTQQDPSSAEVN